MGLGHGTQGFRDVGLGNVGTWGLGMLDSGIWRSGDAGMWRCEIWGRQDMINKQHLNFELNL